MTNSPCLLLCLGSLLFMYTKGAIIDTKQCDHHEKRLSIPGENAVVCYKVLNTSQTYHYKDAKDACADQDMMPVSVTSEHDSTVLQGLMASHTMIDIWLGIYEHLGTWRWLDGSEVYKQGCHKPSPDNPDWNLALKSASVTVDTCTQHCKALNKRYTFLQYGDHCYCSDNADTQGQTDGCNLVCRGHDGPVAPRGDIALCGGQTAVSFYATTAYQTFYWWADGQPNNHLDYQTCAVLDPTYDYMWNDVECKEYHGAVCQQAWTGVAEDCTGAVYEDICYTIVNSSQTFFWSRAKCLLSGGDLALLTSLNATEAVVQHIKKSNLTMSGYFIGLIKGEWVWESGHPLTYSNWKGDQPNTAAQKCATLTRFNSEGSGLWSDEDCSDLHGVICMADNSSVVTWRKGSGTSTSTMAPASTTTELPANTKPWFSGTVMYIIIGVAAGVVLFLILIITTCCICKCGKKKEKKQEEAPYTGELHFGVDVATDIPQADSNGIEVRMQSPERNSGNPPDLIPTDHDKSMLEGEAASGTTTDLEPVYVNAIEIEENKH